MDDLSVRLLHPQLLHLAIKVRSLQTHLLRSLRHVAMASLDLLLDVLDLEIRCRIT